VRNGGASPPICAIGAVVVNLGKQERIVGGSEQIDAV